MLNLFGFSHVPIILFPYGTHPVDACGNLDWIQNSAIVNVHFLTCPWLTKGNWNIPSNSVDSPLSLCSPSWMTFLLLVVGIFHSILSIILVILMNQSYTIVWVNTQFRLAAGCPFIPDNGHLRSSSSETICSPFWMNVLAADTMHENKSEYQHRVLQCLNLTTQWRL